MRRRAKEKQRWAGVVYVTCKSCPLVPKREIFKIKKHNLGIVNYLI